MQFYHWPTEFADIDTSVDIVLLKEQQRAWALSLSNSGNLSNGHLYTTDTPK